MAVQTSYADLSTRGIEGQLADISACDVVSGYNAESSAEIAFGRAVCYGASDRGVLLPATENDLPKGITVYVDQYDASELGTVGVVAGGRLSILRKGRVLLMARKAVTRGDRGWIRAVSSGTGFETLGGLENADDSTDMIDATGKIEWVESAAQGALAWADVDFTNE